jgi:hypothetical protein
MGLQEERVARDAWKSIASALERLKVTRDASQEGSTSNVDVIMDQ